MSISAFEHPFLSGLLGDQPVAALFSVEAEIEAMLAFETALAKAQAGAGVIPEAAAMEIAAGCAGFVPDIAALRNGTARDGVVVPDLVRQLRDAVKSEAAPYVHFGATSQDVIDTALMLRLKRAGLLLADRLSGLDEALHDAQLKFGSRRLTGHTRMQAALPIDVSDRIGAWRDPLLRHRQRLEDFAVFGFTVQFGGAVGTLENLGDKADAVRGALAAELSLTDASQWQSQRDRMVELAGLFALITGSLGKLGQDIALLAQMGGEIVLAGGGGSSAMAHKQNPVAAEALVAIGRFNAVQVSGMQQAMIHEQERSGAAWTLEWMIMPSMVMATGVSLRLALDLVENIKSLGAVKG